MSRILAQFSCGAASAVATKLAIAEHGENVVIVNAFIVNEHPDNRRFLADCEVWFGKPVTVLRDEKFGADIINVFRRVQYIKGRNGAACTMRIKRGSKGENFIEITAPGIFLPHALITFTHGDLVRETACVVDKNGQQVIVVLPFRMQCNTFVNRCRTGISHFHSGPFRYRQQPRQDR